MRGLQARVRERAPAVDVERVGPSGGLILMTLADIEPAPTHVLVRRMLRDKSQMARGIKSLESKGLICRFPCGNDARVTVLALTDQGRAAVARFRGVVVDVLDDMLAPLEVSEKVALEALLSKALPEPFDTDRPQAPEA